VPNYKVEIGFSATNQVLGYMVLDQGQLDVAELYGGNDFYDVTSYVKAININRGKSRQLDRYSSGQASVDFANQGRVFDPTYTSSPFYGEIVPKRKLRIWVDNALAFVGIIDDWDLNYQTNGQSIATANASDALVLLANRTLTPVTSTPELSGARVESVLNDPLVSFPLAEREIDTGVYELGDDVISENVNALTYLQNIETSEGGNLFIGANGNLIFRENYSLGALTSLKFADDGTGISYGNLRVNYGSELLYNEINATSAVTLTTVTASDTTSQNSYGIVTLDLADLLLADDAELQQLADYYLANYRNPELRFESLQIHLQNLSTSQQEQVLDLELGDILQVSFTPEGISPAIEQYAQVNSISHDINTENHIMTIGLATLGATPFRLDSALFGKLDVNTLG
jgi:hypothetical protein